MCFSPTGGGEKIAKTIRRGMLGHLDEGMEPYLFVIPVYGDHMPVPARECFAKVYVTDNRPAILVAVYGNRAFEHALVDLEDFVRGRGFNHGRRRRLPAHIPTTPLKLRLQRGVPMRPTCKQPRTLGVG